MCSGSPAGPLLSEFAVAMQDELPGCLVGINVLDKPGKTFRSAVFPSLPRQFGQHLENNIITGNRGSCGLGILSGKIIEVSDVANDPRFSEDWKNLFKHYQLTSLISVPVLTLDGIAQGSLAVIHPLDSPLTEAQRELINRAAVLCAKICSYSRTQETAELLIGELEHRMRNLFLTVGGLANLTIKRYPAPSEFRKVFGERLMMMHRAQAISMRTEDIDLASLIQETLAPYSTEWAIEVAGPAIVLAQDAASAIALVVYELGTNSVKYGALSSARGQLKIDWSIIPAQQDRSEYFALTWKELNGPEVSAPVRPGYGTTMIRGNLRNAFDGAATLSFDKSGLVFEVTAPFTTRLGRSANDLTKTP